MKFVKEIFLYLTKLNMASNYVYSIRLSNLPPNLIYLNVIYNELYELEYPASLE